MVKKKENLNLENILEQINIKSGDTILVSSDILILLIEFKKKRNLMPI